MKRIHEPILAGAILGTLSTVIILFFLQTAFSEILLAGAITFTLMLTLAKLLLYICDKTILKKFHDKHIRKLSQDEEDLAKSEEELKEFEEKAVEKQQSVETVYENLNADRNQFFKDISSDNPSPANKNPSNFDQSDTVPKAVRPKASNMETVRISNKYQAKIDVNGSANANVLPASQPGLTQAFFLMLKKGSTFFNFETRGDKIINRYKDHISRIQAYINRSEKVLEKNKIVIEAAAHLRDDQEAYAAELRKYIQSLKDEKQKLGRLQGMQP